MFTQPLTRQIVDFLTSIGLTVAAAELREPTFLPGLTISHGVLLVDEPRLLHPGDILHEAGHLALFPSAERPAVTAPLEADPGFEMAAIAWSYAAARAIGVPIEILFHPAGYKGGAQSLIENFSAGHYVGVPLLEWAGMTLTGQRSRAAGVAPYPAMQRWLRPSPP